MHFRIRFNFLWHHSATTSGGSDDPTANFFAISRLYCLLSGPKTAFDSSSRKIRLSPLLNRSYRDTYPNLGFWAVRLDSLVSFAIIPVLFAVILFADTNIILCINTKQDFVLIFLFMSNTNLLMESPRERISHFLESKGISVSKASLELGFSLSYLGKILKSNREITDNVLIAMRDKYGLSATWIKEGKGEMIDTSINTRDTGSIIPGWPVTLENIVNLPFLTLKAYASFVENLQDCHSSEELESYQMLVLNGLKLTERHIVIEVAGDSMTPEIKENSKVLAECINKENYVYQTSGVYAVVFGNQFVVKRISSNKLLTSGTLLLTSDNPKGGEFEVNHTDIRGMWKVLKVIDQKVS